MRLTIANCESILQATYPLDGGATLPSNILKETNTLLSSLLSLANWEDFLILVVQEDNISERLEFFYSWLVEDLGLNAAEKSYAFLSVSRALEAQCITDVSLIQKYASRALSERRKAESSCENRPTCFAPSSNGQSCYSSEDDDSEDEL